MKHEILKFKKGLFDYYRNTVSGNNEITMDQARRKMTRNMLLAAKSDSTEFNSQRYMYGSLHFNVNERGVITWIGNRKFTPQGWELDKEAYVRLSRELGVEDAVSYDGLVMRELKHQLKHKYDWNRRGMVHNKEEAVV
jgi:hypothetical protein